MGSGTCRCVWGVKALRKENSSSSRRTGYMLDELLLWKGSEDLAHGKGRLGSRGAGTGTLPPQRLSLNGF